MQNFDQTAIDLLGKKPENGVVTVEYPVGQAAPINWDNADITNLDHYVFLSQAGHVEEFNSDKKKMGVRKDLCDQWINTRTKSTKEMLAFFFQNMKAKGYTLQDVYEDINQSYILDIAEAYWCKRNGLSLLHLKNDLIKARNSAPEQSKEFISDLVDYAQNNYVIMGNSKELAWFDPVNREIRYSNSIPADHITQVIQHPLLTSFTIKKEQDSIVDALNIAKTAQQLKDITIESDTLDDIEMAAILELMNQNRAKITVDCKRLTEEQKKSLGARCSVPVVNSNHNQPQKQSKSSHPMTPMLALKAGAAMSAVCAIGAGIKFGATSALITGVAGLPVCAVLTYIAPKAFELLVNPKSREERELLMR